MKNSKEYFVAEYKAQDAYMSDQTKNLFEAGFDYAMSQPKHLLDSDYPVCVGDVRRYKGSLYKAVEFVVNESDDNDSYDCRNCAFHKSCFGLIPCENGLKFVEIKE